MKCNATLPLPSQISLNLFTTIVGRQKKKKCVYVEELMETYYEYEYYSIVFHRKCERFMHCLDGSLSLTPEGSRGMTVKEPIMGL